MVQHIAARCLGGTAGAQRAEGQGGSGYGSGQLPPLYKIFNPTQPLSPYLGKSSVQISLKPVFAGDTAAADEGGGAAD